MAETIERDKEELLKLGAFVRSARKSLKLTQEKLADMIGTRAYYISEIEAGIRNPKYTYLLRLFSVLGASVDPLFLGGTDELDEAGTQMLSKYKSMDERERQSISRMSTVLMAELQKLKAEYEADAIYKSSSGKTKGR